MRFINNIYKRKRFVYIIHFLLGIKTIKKNIIALKVPHYLTSNIDISKVNEFYLLYYCGKKYLVFVPIFWEMYD